MQMDPEARPVMDRLSAAMVEMMTERQGTKTRERLHQMGQEKLRKTAHREAQRKLAEKLHSMFNAEKALSLVSKEGHRGEGVD